MQQVNMEVMKEAADKGKPVDEEELTKRIHKLLNSFEAWLQVLINVEEKQSNTEKTKQ